MERSFEETLRERAKAAEAEQKNTKKIAGKKNRKESARVGNVLKKKATGFDASGKPAGREIGTGIKVLAGIAGVIAVLLLLVYVPPLFSREKTFDKPYLKMTPDATAMMTSKGYLKDSPGLDFDEDGLDNSMEEQKGTDPWASDTDRDGISDYAELYVTDTSPSSADYTLQKKVLRADQKNKVTLGDPYKIDDILMWPSDYYSKAYGGVVRTVTGIRFYRFTGWVKFPEKLYAYAYENGIHRELPHDDDADAWKIDGDYEVRTYGEPLEFTDVLHVPFIGDIYLETNGFDDFLERILPKKGPSLTCRKMAVIDTEPDTTPNVENPISLPYIDRSNESRFGRNQNSLDDYRFVIESIDKGYCIGVSMFSDTVGEAIGVIYGYTGEGNLLVANESLEPAGEITILPYAMRRMEKDGEVGQITWYEWYGFGFDSRRYGDKIRYISSTSTDVMTKRDREAEKKDGTQPESARPETEAAVVFETEAVTEAVTEAPAPPETEAHTEAPAPQKEVTIAQPETSGVTMPEPDVPGEEMQDGAFTFSLP